MRDLSQWADFATGGHPEQLDPLSVTPSDIRLWIGRLARQGDSPRTLKRKLSSLRTFFGFMMKRHGMKSNPAAELHSAKADKPSTGIRPSVGNGINARRRFLIPTNSPPCATV